MEKRVFVLTFILCAVITLNLASFIHSACAMICAAEIILAKCILFFSSGIAWNKMNELQTSLFAFSLMVCFVLFLFLFWLFKKTMLLKVLWLLKRVDGATQLVNRAKEFFSLSANIIHVSRDRILKSSKKSSKRSCDGSRLEWRSGRDLWSLNLLKSHPIPSGWQKTALFLPLVNVIEVWTKTLL